MPTNKLNFDYFYGIEADQFTFYRIPKELFTNTYFKGLSAEAKILYGLMLDRMSLSRKSNWLDNENRVYIIFRNEEVKTQLCCGNDKASKLFAELEKYNLISRKKRGQGHPSLIFVKNIYSSVSNDENADVNDEDVDSDNEYVPNSNQQDFKEDEQGEVASQNDYTDFNGEYYEFEKS
ncbi:MAG: replication initiator protein A [Clostridia bacterium]|nr:replication initiator protein A [Clostridia bacterium]